MTEENFSTTLHNIQLGVLLHTVYNQKDRHYHDIKHIKFLHAKSREWLVHEMTNIFGTTEEADLSQEQQDSANKLMNIANRVDTAIWWHDYEYNVFNPPMINELLSAKAYESFTGSNHDPLISSAIQATAFHLQDQELPDNDEGMVIKVMLDVDLVGFAQSLDVVMQDSHNILMEYMPTGVPLQTLFENRIKFLNELLARTRIFYTDYFFNTYEALARDNIKASIEMAETNLKMMVQNAAV